jgi:hypothetical protein
VAFQAIAYSIGAFRDLLKKHSEISDSVLAAKLRTGFFEDYFEKIGVESIIVEESYVDHDYLEDFSAYYVKCFHPYRRNCTRLHFFRIPLSEADFSEFLQGKGPLDVQKLTDAYRGFLVIRPLPSSIIGRTCLATYDSDAGRRQFPSVSQSSANLFGMDLSIETLPFQEQDQVTAACATSALWSAFQATGRMFQHRLPSPVEITRAATSHMPLRSRAFPNTDGLTIEQMAHAIREIGLEPYFVAAKEETVFRNAVYAYGAAGIPALIVFSLSADKNGTRTHIGYHAAAVTGYSLPTALNLASTDSVHRAAQIQKLYVHDDQVGPHARMEFRDHGPDWYLTTSWGLGAYSDVRAHPIAVLLPLYHKIRIPFTRALEDVLSIDHALTSLRRAVPALSGALTWDLRLTTVNRLKHSVLESALTTGPLKENLLTHQFPRFMWHATATNSAGPLVDVLLDATDIDSGRYICRFDVHDRILAAVIDHVASTASNTQVGRELATILGKKNDLAS